MNKYKHPIISGKAIMKVERILTNGILSGFRGTPEGQAGGKAVQELDEAFREYFGVKHAVSMNSATACLHAAMIACRDVPFVPFGEAIVTPYSFSSSASCALMADSVPRFADIDEDTFCIRPDSIKDLIRQDHTKVILPVHLCGHPADMDEIMTLAKTFNLKVVEDAAQAIGAKYKGKYVGTIGDCGIFSFNQSKHVCTGEGGMLITNDDYIARVARAMRNHGEIADPELGIVGYNYRMCEIEAVLALEQFKQLGEMNAWRINLCDYMTEKLKEIEGFTPPLVKPDCIHTYYTYAVKYNRKDIPRDDFQDRLIAEGVYFGKGYAKPLYLLPIYKKFGYKWGLCPITERMYTTELMVTDIFKYPMTIKDCDEVIGTIKRVLVYTSSQTESGKVA